MTMSGESPLILLTEQELDITGYIDRVFHDESGAVVHFIGTVRKEGDGRELVSLFYEAYTEMAEKRLGEILAEAASKWDLRKMLLVHRLGEVRVGEPSVVIAVSAPHRREAFEACSWIMDSVKKDVPIWKKDMWK
jgi:molybdopterin synthase catalytic subunit